MAASSNRSKDIFLQALDLSSPDERAVFVAQACASDESLRRQVEAMLHAHAASDSFLEKPAAAMGPTIDELPCPRPSPSASEVPGTRVGPYKLLQQLGEGGMGVVFLAEQQEPVRRMVALKIIKQGMDSGQIVARFESERQALALMDHPNIAKVLDAGTTDSGRPYFVMELIKGIPITKFCDQEHLTPRERLELFIPVCQAVQHAHQKGIIHRDLKPSNVLIALYDGKPVPKVIDFGVAKATSQKLTERTLFTEVGSMVGTLEYMAPEQAELNNLDIDTRADIYALGVLLYELLTGSPPFSAKELRSNAFADMLRIIREVEPPKPSTKLSASQELPAIAACRKLEPNNLTRQVRGDLDWIVMKCLEKERGRRYETANAVVQDIQRYLTDEPVLAGPPSAGYRLRKFVKRNRGIVTATAAVALTLFAGIAGTSWGWVEALWQRDDAVQARTDETDQRKKAVAAIALARDEAVARADAEENGRKLAEKVVEADKAKIATAKRQVRLIEANLALERGTARCERGEIGPGLLWLARGLEVVPEDAHDLKRSLRMLLGGWSGQMHTLKSVRPLPGHMQGIYPRRAFFYSSDGKTVLCNAGFFAANKLVSDAVAVFYDVAMDKTIGPIVRHDDMTTAAMSPDGKTYLTAHRTSPDAGKVQLWDVATRKPNGPPLLLKRYPSLNSPSVPSTFSPDGKKILIADYAGGADLWDVVERRRIATLDSGGNTHCAVAFSPDGRIAVTMGHNQVRLWDAETGKSLGDKLVHEPHEGNDPLAAAFSPDSRTLATGANGTAHLWEVTTCKPMGQPLKHGQFLVGALAFSPDSKLLLTGSWNSPDVRLWDVASGKPVGIPLRNAWVLRVSFSSDGKSIETVSADGVRVWEVGGQKPFRVKARVNEQRSFWTLSPDGKTVVAEVILNARQTIGLWDLATGEYRGQPVLGEANIACVAFSPDGKTLVTGSGAKGTAHLWDVATGKRRMELQANENHVTAIAFRPDGKMFLIGGRDRGLCTFRLWDAESGASLCAPVAHPDSERSGMLRAAFSPDGNTFVTAVGRTAQRWDTASRKAIGVPLHHDLDITVLAEITALAFSPDGKVLVTGSDDHTVRRWNANTGESLGEPLRHGHMVRSAVFNPAGDLLLTGSLDKSARLWDVATGRLAGETMVHPTSHLITAGVPLARFSDDGKTILTALDKEVRLWDVHTRKLIGAPLPHEHGAMVSNAAFLPDSKTIVTAYNSGNVLLWKRPVPLTADVERIRLWLGVNTGQELDAGGTVVDLDAKTWRERYDRLQKLGGLPMP